MKSSKLQYWVLSKKCRCWLDRCQPGQGLGFEGGGGAVECEGDVGGKGGSEGVGRGAAQARRPVSRPSSSHPDTCLLLLTRYCLSARSNPQLKLPLFGLLFDSDLAPTALMTTTIGW